MRWFLRRLVKMLVSHLPSLFVCGRSMSYFCNPYVGQQTNVTVGTHGMNDGYVPVPHQPPLPNQSWLKGGNRWVYDEIYGYGQRPIDGVWDGPEARVPAIDRVLAPPPWSELD
uniref:Secreted protein n=1 Tax=Hanusia phi TaxID=3032 RepID=A0A7S0EUG3_9CRYP